MFFQPKETYPDDKMFIGIWIVPAIDVGTAMTYKILRPDGGYVCRSTVRSWTSKEEANPVSMAKRVYFMNQLNSFIGHAAKLSDFPLNDLTSEFEYYADGIEDGFEGTPDETKEAPPPTPEDSDNYVGSILQLPRGQGLSQGRVLKRARDKDDNVIGRANENSILVVATKKGLEALRRIRFKLRMMGVKIDVSTYVYGDNMSVIHDTSKPEYVLKNKYNSICYNFVREAIAMRECLTTHVPTARNWDKLLTKVLFGKKRKELVQGVLFDI